MSELDEKPRRINVAINDETVAALQNVIDREGVTLTEAVRRLMGYGDYVYRRSREDESELLVKRRWRAPRKVTIL